MKNRNRTQHSTKLSTSKLYPVLLLALLLLLLVFTIAYAANIDPTDKWAWGTNLGWLNFNDANGGVTIYDDHLEGYVWAENIGWIRLGTYDGGGAHIYANDAADTYGVNHDGAGNLSGYAWGTNVGWINFNPTNDGVTINLDNGSFDGYAWGENIGWIHFKNTTGNAYNVVTTWQPGAGGGVGDDAGGGAGDGGRSFAAGSSGGTYTHGPVRVIIPGELLSDGTRLVINELDTSDGDNFQLGGRVFDIKIFGPNSQQITSFDLPLKVCIKPTNAELQAAGWNFNNLNMFHQHGGGSWAAVINTFEENGYLCAEISQLSYFAIGIAQLPNTGFAPGMLQTVPQQPVEMAYTTYDGFWLEIPSLGIEMPIVGVPLTARGWDVTWLGDQAGYLHGTAYPTWVGNTAITAHVWDRDNNPGPFVDLHTLQHGDEVIIHAWGIQHIYEVRDIMQVKPDTLKALPHSEYDMLTLITCMGYDESSSEYDWRLAVQAVLMKVEAE